MKSTIPGLIELRETTSTNDYMEMLLSSSNPEEGSVVCALFQTSGKGQENNRWESEAGRNILATAVLYPHFLRPDQQFFLTIVVSLSVCTLISKTEPALQPKIKWPNDIYLNNRKIAGILIKNALSGDSIQHTITGLGMNINQTRFSANAPLAVSLSEITGKKYHIPTLLTNWHESLMWWYNQLRENRLSMLEAEYLGRLYLIHQPAAFIIRGKRLTATIAGIGEFGKLRMVGEDGTEYLCDLKEVIFVPLEG